MGADALMQVLHRLPHVKDKDLLVGIETADDAGVYRLSPSLAVVSTLDFFPPIVDDPYDFGQIAAANALSDVYAMGGVPRLAMNMVCFPRGLALGVLGDIIRGSMDKLREAGALLVGGHSIEDSEVKYGLSVTGFVDPRRMTTNAGARPGDALVLTKPLGTGVITSALKAGRMRRSGARAAIEGMKALNRAACEAMVACGVRAATDVTGYGLVGHAVEMARASGVGMVIRGAAIPVLPGALKAAGDRANRPRNLMGNIESFKRDVKTRGIDPSIALIIHDPQTSGGLLMAVPEETLKTLMSRLRKRRVEGVIIGSVVRKERGHAIRVE
jgi:selenide,water dikinase